MLFTPKKLELNEADSTESNPKETTSTPQKTPEIQNEPKTPEKTPDRKLRRRTTGKATFATPKQRLHRYAFAIKIVINCIITFYYCGFL